MDRIKSVGIDVWINTLINDQLKLSMWWIWLIIFSKVVRYTILYETLVKPGIGWHYLSILNSHQASPGISLGSDEVINPSDNAMFLLQMLNYLDITSYYGYEIAITAIGNFLLFCLVRRCKPIYTSIEALFIVVAIMTLNVFVFTLSKDAVQLLFFVSLFFALRITRDNALNGIIVVSLLILVDAVSFRLYYMLLFPFFVIVFIANRMLNNISNHWVRLVGIWITLGISYFIVLYIIQQILPGYYDEMIRVRYRVSDATTDIQLLFHSENIWLLVLDYMILILRLLVPVELILFGPKFIAFLGVQIIYTLAFIGSFRKMKCAFVNRNIAVVIYMAFLGMSATFEPDFGSWIRHECVIFPVLLVALGLDDYKLEKKC